MPTQWVTINSVPEGADVYINEQYEGTTPYTKKMELGSHTYRLELGYYLTEAGKFELTEKDRTDLNKNLIPNFGYVTINSSPEQGALIDLDGIPTNNITPYTSPQLTPGLHKVTVKKVMYNPKTVEFNVVAGETKNLNVEMESNFAKINITTTPMQISILTKNIKETEPILVDCYPDYIHWKLVKKNIIAIKSNKRLLLVRMLILVFTQMLKLALLIL